MYFKLTTKQRDILGRFLYDSTEVTLVVNTSNDKVKDLANELNVTTKRIKKWIENRKRTLKSELFKQGGFQACKIPGLTGDPARSKVKKSRKRACPRTQKRSVRFNATDGLDALPEPLNFEDTKLPNLESKTTEKMSLVDVWEPSNGEPSPKRIKTENLSSIGVTTKYYDASEENSLITQEGHRTVRGFQMDLLDGASTGGIEHAISLPDLNIDSFVNSNAPLSTAENDESAEGLSNDVLFPSFLRGLPGTEPSTPKTPLASMTPTLKIERPFGRPPPCVVTRDEVSTLEYVQQSSFIKQPTNNMLIRAKTSENFGAEATAAIRTRKKLTDNQQLILESFFAANLFTTKKIKEAVAQSAGLPFKKVKTWIQNRKRRDKKGLPSPLPEIKPPTARGCSEIQRRQLVAFFNAGLLDEPNYREAIAKATGLTEKKIQIWRMNTRAKLKKEGTLECPETSV